MEQISDIIDLLWLRPELSLAGLFGVLFVIWWVLGRNINRNEKAPSKATKIFPLIYPLLIPRIWARTLRFRYLVVSMMTGSMKSRPAYQISGRSNPPLPEKSGSCVKP